MVQSQEAGANANQKFAPSSAMTCQENLGEVRARSFKLTQAFSQMSMGGITWQDHILKVVLISWP